MRFYKHLGIIILLAFLLIKKANSQTSIGSRIWGAQFSSFTNASILRQIPGSYNYQERNIVGVLIGISHRFTLKNQNCITTEVLFSMRGQSSSYKSSQLDGYNIVTLSGNNTAYIEYVLDYRTNYVEIPILYTMDLSKRDKDSKVHVYLSSGISTGINISSKLKQNSFKIKSPGAILSGIDEVYTDTEITQTNTFILNFITDLEFEFRRGKKAKYFFYGRLNQSLSNVFESSYSTTKMTTLGFGFGMRWYLNK